MCGYILYSGGSTQLITLWWIIQLIPCSFTVHRHMVYFIGCTSTTILFRLPRFIENTAVHRRITDFHCRQITISCKLIYYLLIYYRICGEYKLTLGENFRWYSSHLIQTLMAFSGRASTIKITESNQYRYRVKGTFAEIRVKLR